MIKLEEKFNKYYESLLIEDINTIMALYPNISINIFNKLIRLDPTFKEGKNSLGKYGKWILNLYNKNIVKDEDLYKIPDLLKQFEEKRNSFSNKDIGQFKSLPELAKALSEVSNLKLNRRQIQRRNQSAARHSNKDIELFYEDDNWFVYIPHSYAASVKLGENTEWCTASNSSDEMYYYYKDTYSGDYFIFINKEDPQIKYQWHIESNQFMDRYDDSIRENTGIRLNLYDNNTKLKALIDNRVQQNSNIFKDYQKYIDTHHNCTMTWKHYDYCGPEKLDWNSHYGVHDALTNHWTETTLENALFINPYETFFDNNFDGDGELIKPTIFNSEDDAEFIITNIIAKAKSKPLSYWNSFLNKLMFSEITGFHNMENADIIRGFHAITKPKYQVIPEMHWDDFIKQYKLK